MIVLDTHALVWWVNGDSELSATAGAAIEAARSDDAPVLVSAISTWEIALLVRRERMALAMDLDPWLDTVESVEGLEFVPLSRRLLVQSVNLPGEFHKDPADRMIVALARQRNATLLTADSRLHRYPHVRCLW